MKRVGFEPTIGNSLIDLQSITINRSVISSSFQNNVIRTHDFLFPKQARYQTASYSELLTIFF